MNKRQAKKRYKKIHGHNPPKNSGNDVYTGRNGGNESIQSHTGGYRKNRKRPERRVCRDVQNAPKSCGEHGQSV